MVKPFDNLIYVYYKMNDMNNDGTNFRVRKPDIKPPPLARPFGDIANIGVSGMFFDTLEGGRVEGNGNNGDFRASSRRIPLQQEQPVMFKRPLDN